MKEERKEDLVWVPAGLSFRHSTEKGDGNRDSQYMMKQGRTMIQLVGKPPTESIFCYEFDLLSLRPVADKGDHSNRLHQLVARSSIKEFLLKREIKVW